MILKFIQKRFGLVTTSLIILIIVTFSSIQFDFFKLYSNYLSEGFIGTYQTNDLPEGVTRLLSAPLVTLDVSGKPQPYLVAGWEVNSDATIFKFKLKNDLKWSDQTPLKASDLEFNIPDTEVSFPDDKTIQFKLGSSFSPFPTLLTKPVFKKGVTLLGTGPYQVDKLEKSRVFLTKIQLEPAGNFGLPSLSIRFYPNEKTAQTAFALGEIQAIFGITNLDFYKSYPRLQFKQAVTSSKVVAIFYNTQDKLLSTRSLRQALGFQAPEINNEALADSPFPSTSWAYLKPEKDYLTNEEAAKAALDRAKANLSKDLLDKDIILTTTPALEAVGKEIVNSWKELGLKANLRIESGIPQNFQALLITQSIPADPDQYSLWHSTQTKTNISKYDSKRVDKDLEDARKTLDEKERKEKYVDFQRVLLEDAPATFLYYPKFNVVYLEKAKSRLDKTINIQI